MGKEISRSIFTGEDYRQFKQRLDEETALLERWFGEDGFAHEAGVCGLELEGWLLDRDCNPAPENEAFLARLNDALVVPELSRFNFEINTTPQPRAAAMFSLVHAQLAETWRRCEAGAAGLGLVPLHIGILPTLRDDVMTVENMSPLQRYYALNQQVLENRQGSPVKIDIAGANDHLKVEHYDVMTEAATTSLQIHLQLDLARAVRFFNAAHIVAAPMLGACANSPYLFGHELWEETRIPLFEQSVSVPAFYDRQGRLIERVTFGTGYADSSLMEIFRENRDGFPPLLPLLYTEDLACLAHLRLHNGTIWRWNRPLIDFDADGRASLRLEHRVAPAGPSLPDVVANIAFFYGLIHHLALSDEPPERRLSFEHAGANFYQAARYGMRAKVFWLDGREHELRRLLLDELLPASTRALARLGIARDEREYYLDEIMTRRVREGRTGALWQKAFIAHYGRDFTNLTQAYREWQTRAQPVHQWSI